MKFLFPSDVFDGRLPDESFLPQIRAFQEAGFTTGLFSIENAKEGIRSIFGDIEQGDLVALRGWMLNATEYQLYCDAVIRKGANPLTSLDSYLSCHHLPQWVNLLQDYTPRTVVIPESQNLRETLQQLSWDAYFIKDYVKSLKTSSGSFVQSPDEVESLIENMKTFRGEIEGGFCIREVEDFVTDSEIRFFVINGVPYSPLDDQRIPIVVHKVVSLIKSKFFTVDVVQDTAGRDRVVEIGDGQVSDIVGWSATRLAACWRESTQTTL